MSAPRLPSLPKPGDTARAGQLEGARSTYRWDYSWPPGVATLAELPKKDSYSLEFMAKSIEVYAEIGVNLAAMSIESKDIPELLREKFAGLEPHELREHIFTTPRELARRMPKDYPKSIEEYETFFATWKKPDVVAFFHEEPADLDRAFAWQRIAGVDPMVLARCTAIPANLAVDGALYRRVMGEGDSLDAAIAEARLYLADYAALDGVEAGTTDGVQKYLAAPMALFAVEKGTSTLRPVAIQVGQVPGAASPVVAPGDGWRWRMAMHLVQCADANHHEGVAHLGRTHMVMEAVTIAMHRQLAANHPLHRLLSAHTELTLAINESAKTSLIAPGGTVDRCFAPKIEAFGALVKKVLDTYPIKTATPIHDLAARGLDDAEALPEHPYREDVIPVWEAVQRYVGEYVRLYYREDEDVTGDPELMAFVRELGTDDGGRLPEIPEVQTVEQLAAFIGQLVFIAGPGHSCVNFPQFPFMGFAGNMLGASYGPLMTAKTPNDEAEYTKMLAPMDIALEGVLMIRFLSEARTSTLGHYGLTFELLDPRIKPVVDRFQAELEAIEKANIARDESRLITYPFLRPSQILQSISI